MATFKEYLERIYSEEMAGVAETYQLELIGAKITGMVNGKDIGSMSTQEFAQKYPAIAKEVGPILNETGAAAKYAPDKKPPYDFVKSPTTKNQLVATPDEVDEVAAVQPKQPVAPSGSQLHTLTKDKRTPNPAQGIK